MPKSSRSIRSNRRSRSRRSNRSRNKSKSKSKSSSKHNVSINDIKYIYDKLSKKSKKLSAEELFEHGSMVIKLNSKKDMKMTSQFKKHAISVLRKLKKSGMKGGAEGSWSPSPPSPDYIVGTNHQGDDFHMALQQNLPQQEIQHFRFGLQEMGLIAFLIYKIYVNYM